MRVFFAFLVCFLFLFSFVASEVSSTAETSFFIESDADSSVVTNKEVADDVWYSFNFMLLFVAFIIIVVILYLLVRGMGAKKKVSGAKKRVGRAKKKVSRGRK